MADDGAVGAPEGTGGGPPRSPFGLVPAAVRDDSLVALVTALRWAVAGGGVLWAVLLQVPAGALVVGLALLAYALFRTFRPVQYTDRGWRSLWAILAELSVSLAAVVTTGCWESPYIFSLFIPVVAAGFAQGYWHAFRVALTAAATVAAAAALLDLPTGLRPLVSWAGELALVAAIASYGRRLLHRAEQVRSLTMSQLWQLNEANTLLVGLNRLSQELPVSFDLDETMHDALRRVDDATDPDVSALLLLDPVSGNWNVTLSEGARLPDSFAPDTLPAGMAAATGGEEPVHVRDLSPDRPGLSPDARTGVYIPLRAGARRIGLVAIEAVDADRFDEIPINDLRELSRPLALTIDNARWFDKLRARGAAQERTRLARDLHDRVGQGVAYVAFELDRLAARAEGTELADDIDHLRTDARKIVTELRETLYDLRSDVSEQRGLDETLGEFLARVQARSGITVHFDHRASWRLPLAHEREVWRIAQEAVLNAERHSGATHIDVRWDLGDDTGTLTVTDDGVGIGDPQRGAGASTYAAPATPGRPSYGITGMRERAEAIGALLEIDSNEPKGTVVRLTVTARRRTREETAAAGSEQ